MKRSLPGIVLGIVLTAVCWQLSDLLTARPGAAVGVGAILMLSFLALGWIALVVVATCAMRWRAS